MYEALKPIVRTVAFGEIKATAGGWAPSAGFQWVPLFPESRTQLGMAIKEFEDPAVCIGSALLHDFSSLSPSPDVWAHFRPWSTIVFLT